MKLSMFKSKLHQMKVTEANLMYEGSITIDEELMELANLLPYEKVQVVNITNGSRLETYSRREREQDLLYERSCGTSHPG